MKGLCYSCGRTGEMKKVWRARKHRGGSAETYICKDRTKCVGSKAWREAELKKMLRGGN